MELNDVRITLMFLSLAVFAGVAWWAYAPRRRGHFELIGRDILDEGEQEGSDKALNKKEGSRS